MTGGSWRGLPYAALRIPRGRTWFDVVLGLAIASGIPVALVMLLYLGYLMPTVFVTAWFGAQLVGQPIAVWVAVSRRRAGSVLRGFGIGGVVIGGNLVIQVALMTALVNASHPFLAIVPAMMLLMTLVIQLVMAPASLGVAIWAGLHRGASRRRIERLDPDWEKWEIS